MNNFVNSFSSPFSFFQISHAKLGKTKSFCGNNNLFSTIIRKNGSYLTYCHVTIRRLYFISRFLAVFDITSKLSVHVVLRNDKNWLLFHQMYDGNTRNMPARKSIFSIARSHGLAEINLFRLFTSQY